MMRRNGGRVEWFVLEKPQPKVTFPEEVRCLFEQIEFSEPMVRFG